MLLAGWVFLVLGMQGHLVFPPVLAPAIALVTAGYMKSSALFFELLPP